MSDGGIWNSYPLAIRLSMVVCHDTAELAIRRTGRSARTALEKLPILIGEHGVIPIALRRGEQTVQLSPRFLHHAAHPGPRFAANRIDRLELVAENGVRDRPLHGRELEIAREGIERTPGTGAIGVRRWPTSARPVLPNRISSSDAFGMSAAT